VDELAGKRPANDGGEVEDHAGGIRTIATLVRRVISQKIVKISLKRKKKSLTHVEEVKAS